jgi:methionyl-tRNA formyltransferase
MRAIFFGTPEIAVPSLEALARIAEVVGVVCQPDRPAGRGLELRSPPVKVRALALGLDVIQPTKLKTGEVAAFVRGKEADVGIVLAYGRILPDDVLAAPKKGCLNLHASLLPKYRGAAPINWCIVRGETETGISLMQMDAGLDTGPVYTRRAIPIGPDETAGELAARLAGLAATVVAEDVPRAVRGELALEPQDHAAATLAPILEKEHGRIDWAKPARAVHDHVRGMTPWPGAFTKLDDGRTLKVLATRRTRWESPSAAPGTVVAADKTGVLVACADEPIEIVRAQVEGKKPLGAPELVAGRTLRVGMSLG